MVDAKARQDCIKEIDLLKQLNHPNVIKYLSSFVENNEVRPEHLALLVAINTIIKWNEQFVPIQKLLFLAIPAWPHVVDWITPSLTPLCLLLLQPDTWGLFKDKLSHWGAPLKAWGLINGKSSSVGAGCCNSRNTIIHKPDSCFADFCPKLPSLGFPESLTISHPDIQVSLLILTCVSCLSLTAEHCSGASRRWRSLSHDKGMCVCCCYAWELVALLSSALQEEEAIDSGENNLVSTEIAGGPSNHDTWNELDCSCVQYSGHFKAKLSNKDRPF